MPNLKVTASLPELDYNRYLQAYQEAVNQAVIKAARKFLLAAVPRIPVFTGFARGALGNLEDIAGRVEGGRIRGTLGGVQKVKLHQRRTYYYYPPGSGRVVRTNISGRQFATTPAQIISAGQLTRAKTKSRIVFKFSVDITYFDYLDRTKWGAFQAGREAFDAELKIQLERLKPDIKKYIIRREVK